MSYLCKIRKSWSSPWIKFLQISQTINLPYQTSSFSISSPFNIQFLYCNYKIKHFIIAYFFHQKLNHTIIIPEKQHTIYIIWTHNLTSPNGLTFHYQIALLKRWLNCLNTLAFFVIQIIFIAQSIAYISIIHMHCLLACVHYVGHV